eukprot:6195707-Pleurochrysis_carterae.AAC.1
MDAAAAAERQLLKRHILAAAADQEAAPLSYINQIRQNPAEPSESTGAAKSARGAPPKARH